MTHRRLYAAAGILALTAGSSVLAPSLALAQDKASSSALEEVIVTAQKRSENVQSVAATVSVISSETLQARGVGDMRDLTSFAPMINLSKEGIFTQIFIRGIGQPSDAETNDPAVATNIDGVYASRYTLSSALFDIDHVEVLSGPQGTLYGRNAAGGTVNITTKSPKLSDYSGEASLELGNFDAFHAFAAANIPIGDTLAVRAAVDSNKHDGYISNGQDALDSIAARGVALYKPNDALSVLLRTEYQHSGGNGDSIILRPFVRPSDPWYQPSVPGENYFVDRTVYRTNAEISYRFGGAGDVVLTYIPAFVYYNESYREPIGYPINYFPNPAVAGNPLTGFAGALTGLGDIGRQTTHELRLNGDADKLKWVVGLYDFHHVAKGPGASFDIYNPAAFNGGSFTPYSFRSGAGQTYQHVVTDSQAAFGQATYALTDQLRLTLGARYSSDKRRADGLAQTLIPIANLALPAIRYNLHQANKRWDWKVGLEYDLTPQSMLYANIQTGYIGGGFNVAASQATVASFEPEELLAYAAGSKNTFLDGRLRLNAEAFYYDYKNLQVSAFSASTGSSIQRNAPKSTIYGAQVEVAFKLFEHTTLNADAGYLHAEITKALLGPATVYTCAVPGVVPAALCAGTNLIDYSGYQLPNSPEFSASAALVQAWPLANGANLEGRVSTHYEGDSWALFSHIKGLDKPAYHKSDASIAYRAPDDRWTVALWVKNIENYAHLVTPATTSVYGLNTWYIEAPRTYGVRVGANF